MVFGDYTILIHLTAILYILRLVEKGRHFFGAASLFVASNRETSRVTSVVSRG